MDAMARLLSRRVDLPVLNRTGLDGVYNIQLQWSLDSTEVRPDSGPSLFTAIGEQLGLKLRAAKAPVEVLVIDRADRPSGN
jgi:uncharacterized protein (TIGR03435 family)